MLPPHLAVFDDTQVVGISDVGVAHHLGGGVVEEGDRSKLGDDVLSPNRLSEHPDVDPGTELPISQLGQNGGAIGDVERPIPERGEWLGETCLDEPDSTDHPGCGLSEHLLDNAGLTRLCSMLGHR